MCRVILTNFIRLIQCVNCSRSFLFGFYIFIQRIADKFFIIVRSRSIASAIVGKLVLRAHMSTIASVEFSFESIDCFFIRVCTIFLFDFLRGIQEEFTL